MLGWIRAVVCIDLTCQVLHYLENESSPTSLHESLKDKKYFGSLGADILTGTDILLALSISVAAGFKPLASLFPDATFPKERGFLHSCPSVSPPSSIPCWKLWEATEMVVFSPVLSVNASAAAGQQQRCGRLSVQHTRPTLLRRPPPCSLPPPLHFSVEDSLTESFRKAPLQIQASKRHRERDRFTRTVC